MRRRAALLSFAATVSVLALPLAASAASIPFFGPIIPSCGNVTEALGWGAVLIVANNIISLLLTLLIVFVAPLMIAYAGFLLVAYSVNPSGKERARSLITNLIVGFVVALAAWLIVNAIMIGLTSNQFTVNGQTKSWSEIITTGGQSLCLSLQAQPSAPPPAVTPGTGVIVPGAPVPGTCTVTDFGPCAWPKMRTSFGAAAAEQASQICFEESANGTLLEGDRTTSGVPVSIGLFQINMTVHKIGTLDCPSAFMCAGGTTPCRYTGSNKDVRIRDQDLYDQCKAAALTPAQNIATAQRIYQQAGNSWKDWSTAKECGLVFGESPILARVCEIITSV